MFEEFPKRRITLPREFEEIYLSHYKKNRAGATPATFLSKRMERWMHKKVAADTALQRTAETLEIGAGTLNHLSWENCAAYDIVEPLQELYKHSAQLKRVRAVYSDLFDIRQKKYDRIISIAMLEHVLDLPEVVAGTCLLLNDKGVLRVAVPNEGRFLWQLGWKLTTGIEYRLKYGLDYAILMQYEHVNTADEIEAVLNYFYAEIKVSYFGLGKNLSFYRFYECKDPHSDKAEDFLVGRRSSS